MAGGQSTDAPRPSMAPAPSTCCNAASVPLAGATHPRRTHAATGPSSFSPRATIRSDPSGSGLCSLSASSSGALIGKWGQPDLAYISKSLNCGCVRRAGAAVWEAEGCRYQRAPRGARGGNDAHGWCGAPIGAKRNAPSTASPIASSSLHARPGLRSVYLWAMPPLNTLGDERI
jgi:hypothetical protein